MAQTENYGQIEKSIERDKQTNKQLRVTDQGDNRQWTIQLTVPFLSSDLSSNHIMQRGEESYK
jgi:hypothetical protein